MTATPARPASRLGITPAQIWRCAAIGAALWLAAALGLRALGPLGIYEGWARVALYVLVVPVTLPFVPITRWLAGLGRDQVAIGVSVVTATAALLDGVALAWFPALYGSELTLIAGAGAAILWGAGVGMVIGFWLNRAA